MKALSYFSFLLLLSGLIQPNVEAQAVRDTAGLLATWSIEQCISYAKDHNIQITTLKLNQPQVYEATTQEKKDVL